MRNKNTLFYRGRKSVELNFSSSEISSDGSLIMLEKLERDHRLIHYYSKLLPDTRDSRFIIYTREHQLKQRVYMIMLGYEDANDVNHLQNDPLFKDVLQGDLASQPTISRFENSFDKQAVFKFCYAWLYKYVSSLSDRKKIVIDVDSTDDPTHGSQQLSMFNGYYGQFMYNELFFS
ncbi:transposase [Ichthyobacterium seriolicida]|uniref:Transposase n=1 Tax=Ichthyobacterium seriolicida TaxID=242600 RepID=A0A1J1EBQ9_9FLAO|nr:transposase [Ichthyobacterium seriolicida]BAV94203.1 transposase [Ichthyobacterium seriolicida]BAV95371.1 transposase [Ichthyobacterium seriolicida]